MAKKTTSKQTVRKATPAAKKATRRPPARDVNQAAHGMLGAIIAKTERKSGDDSAKG